MAFLSLCCEQATTISRANRSLRDIMAVSNCYRPFAAPTRFSFVAAAAITLSFSLDLSTATARLAVCLGAGGRGQKLLSAAVGAKVVRLAIALTVDGGRFVHGHSADGVFGH